MSAVTATRLSFKIRYALLTAAVSFVLMIAMTFTYINYVDRKADARERKSDQQWCELVTFYDDYYMNNPPTTELQRQQASLMHKRRTSLGCPH